MLLPGLGHHHHDGFLQGPAVHQQELQHVVERARIAAIRLDDREQALQIVSEQFTFRDTLAGTHPVAVSAQRIDFPVVAHKPQRLCTVPTGERVRRKPAVHHRQVSFEIRIIQIGEIRQHLRRRQHPFVNDHLGAERTDVEHQRLLQRVAAAQHMAGAFANDVQLTFKRVAFQSLGRPDEQLFDHRLRRAGGRPDVSQISRLRHITPAVKHLSAVSDQLLNGFLAMVPLCIVLRQEHESCGETAGRGQVDAQVLLGDLGQKLVRQSTHHSTAVTRIRFTPTSTTVVHRAQDLVGIQDVLMARHAFDVCNESDPTRVLFVGRVIQPLPLGKVNQFFSHRGFFR